MIDPTKPIRRKRDKQQAVISKVRGYTKYYAEPYNEARADGPMTLEELDHDYENIPEPRKPREWGALIQKDNIITVDSEVGLIRVIEWPKGAPLPEWPEGYG